jgi:hypothetical protein
MDSVVISRSFLSATSASYMVLWAHPSTLRDDWRICSTTYRRRSGGLGETVVDTSGC